MAHQRYDPPPYCELESFLSRSVAAISAIWGAKARLGQLSDWLSRDRGPATLAMRSEAVKSIIDNYNYRE